MTNDDTFTKQTLRTTAKARRDALSPTLRDMYSREITKRVCAQSIIESAEIFHVYISFSTEVSTHELLRALFAMGKRVVIPLAQAHGILHHVEITQSMCDTLFFDHTERDRFGIPTLSNYEHFSLEECSRSRCVVILPMLAFDAARHRLGWGRGYYDRFLSQIPTAQTIGIAFACQQIEHIPAEAHDIRADMIITESAIFAP